MSNKKTVEWVSWFVDGKAMHFRADSPVGTRILVRLAELKSGSRPCAGPNCERPIGGRADRRYCSDSCAKASMRSRTEASIRGRSGGEGIDLPDTPIARTNDAPRPGVSRSNIADTADRSRRRCANCDRDISTKRKGAVVCGDNCRKAIARRASAIAAQAELSDLLGQPQLFEESP